MERINNSFENINKGNLMNTTNSKFEILTNEELMETEGGFVVTGTMVGIGVGILTGSFAVGYAVGQSTKK